MTLQALQYFIAVAKHKNFTKAAEECFVTQPALSRAIRELEEELGCRLFARNTRSVVLTAAGEYCLAEAKRITGLCQKLPEKVRRHAMKEEPPLSVGYVIYDHLMALMQKLSEGNPGGELPARLDAQYFACSEAKRRFREGELDALLLPEPCVADLEEAESVCIRRVKMSVIVPRHSPFFERQSIPAAELKGSRFVGWDPKETPLLHEAYLQALRSAGFEPEVIDYAEKLGDMAMRVITQNAIGFGSTIAYRKDMEDIRFIPVEDSPETFGLHFVWHRDDGSLRLRLIRELLGKTLSIS